MFYKGQEVVVLGNRAEEGGYRKAIGLCKIANPYLTQDPDRVAIVVFHAKTGHWTVFSDDVVPANNDNVTNINCSSVLRRKGFYD